MWRARSALLRLVLAASLGGGAVVPHGAQPAAAVAPKGAVTFSFRANGTLPWFPCENSGCGVSFGGDAVATTQAVSTDRGYVLDPVWEFIGIVRNSGRYQVGLVAAGPFHASLVYGEPGLPYCPTTGALNGPVRMTAPATGVVRRLDPPAVGTVVAVDIALDLRVQRVGATAAVVATGTYPAQVQVHYRLPDESGTIVHYALGVGAAAFALDPVTAVQRCLTPGPVPFTFAGQLAVELW